MEKLIRILILEHDALDIELLQHQIKKTGLNYTTEVVATPDTFKEALKEFKPHLILSDYNLPSFNAEAAFSLTQEFCPDIPFIIVSGTLGEEKAVELIKNGVTDYVLKDKLFTIIPKIHRALKEFNEHREKVKAAKKNKEYAQQIEGILQSIGEGFFVLNNKWTITYWNNAAESIIGLSKNEVLGKNLWDVFEGARDLKFYTVYQQVIDERQPANFEEYYPPLDMWFEVAAFPYKDGLTVYFKNINQRIAQEKAIRLANQRFETVSRATKDAIWDWDIQSDKVSWNNGLELLFGYASENAIESSEKWFEYLHPEDKNRVASKLKFYLTNSIEVWQDEFRFLCADGTYKYVYDRGIMLLDENKKPFRMIGTMMDLTALKQMEETLLQERIQQQSLLAKAIVEGQEKERTEIGKELHDNINQILATVKLYIELAISNSELKGELLNKSLKNLNLSINEIRSLSKSLIETDIKEISIVDSLLELKESFEFASPFTVSLDHSGFTDQNIDGKLQLTLYRIAQEHFNNINKYANATKVDMRLFVENNWVCLQISDDGKGFNLKRNYEGIGLINMRSRAEILKGQFEIISSEGNGCTLNVMLPVMEDAPVMPGF